MVSGSILVGKSLLSGRGLHPPLLRQIVRGLASLLWRHGRLDHWRRRKLYFHQDHKLYSSCHMFWSKPASYSQLHSYKQRWWLLRGTQVLVSWLLLWCWVDDYWSFFDYCCGVHPSHGLLRLGLPLPFQPEVTCFVHPPLHKHGKELPASIENMLIPKMSWL